jgi:serine/threonine protein kinase
MPARFETLKALEETTTSTLKLVRDSQLKSDFVQRRFKTTDAAEMEGLPSLFAQLAALNSPQLDRLIEAGADEKGFFVLTPAPLEGVSLPEMLQRGPLSAHEFEILANQLLDALEAVHDQAIVHGTLTPECVRIIGAKPAEWQVRLGGFGTGFAAQGTEEEQQIAAYRCAAPEQWQKSPARRRTDIYALGCVLYEALAGRPAFQSRSLKQLRVKHLGRDLPDLSKVAPHVPRWMADWVMSLIVTDAEARPRKASVARETFAMREAAPSAPPPAPVSPATPLVSAPVMLPMSQPARNATASTIPISVGPQIGAPPAPRKPAAVLAIPKPAARHFSQQPVARPLWQRPTIWGIAAAVMAVASWSVMSGSKTAPKGAGGSSASLVDVPTTDPAEQSFRELGKVRQRFVEPTTTPASVLPADFTKP